VSNRSTTLHACLVALGLTLLNVAPQDTPDFSGRWVLQAPADAPPDVSRVIVVRRSARESTPRDSTRKPPLEELTIRREFENGVSVETHAIGLQGGSVAGVHADGTPTGPSTYRSARWSGPSLMLESGSYRGPVPEQGVRKEQQETWSLARGGRLRITRTVRSSRQPARTVALIYRQQSLRQSPRLRTDVCSAMDLAFFCTGWPD
jgi:hypothetical protein